MTPKLPPENARGSVPLGRRDLAALRAFSTAAVCDAVAELAPERRGFGYTTGPLLAARSDLPPVVGYACTATVQTAAPPHDGSEDAALLAWLEHVAGAAKPAIAVIQDIDGRRDGIGACWDKILGAIHVALGCEALLTDGAIRDVTGLPAGFQLLSSGIKPAQGWLQWHAFGGTVNVAGMTVTEGEIIHLDRHGAVIVPAELVREIPAAIEHSRAQHAELLAICARPDIDFAALEPLLRGQRQTRWCS